MIFSQSIAKLIAERGLIENRSAPSSISIYAGTQPTPATIASSWASYNTSSPDFLIHFTGVTWSRTLAQPFIAITTFPPLTQALQTGTASWCIVWSTAVTLVNVQGGTLPNSTFIVGAVTDLTGKGIVKFNPSTSLVATQTYTIADGVITVGIV